MILVHLADNWLKQWPFEIRPTLWLGKKDQNWTNGVVA